MAQGGKLLFGQGIGQCRQCFFPEPEQDCGLVGRSSEMQLAFYTIAGGVQYSLEFQAVYARYFVAQLGF